MQVAQCGNCWLTTQDIESSNPSSNRSRNHLPKDSVCPSVSWVKKMSGVFNPSFILIAFTQYHILMWGKNDNDFPWIELLRKNHKYFPYDEKIVIPSTSQTQLTWHAAVDCKKAFDGRCLKPGETPIWKGQGCSSFWVQIKDSGLTSDIDDKTWPFLAVKLSFRVHSKK